MDAALTLVLAGDAMTGRGVDQVLAHPGSPELREDYLTDAREYVDLARAAHGPVPAPVPDGWPWADALATEPDEPAPAMRVLNLETAVTRSDDWAPGKAVHYRMSPANVRCLVAAGADVWTLANNHVLDFGPAGLEETLAVLHDAGLRTAGAGPDDVHAWAPAVVGTGPRRLLVWSVAHGSSGVPHGWAATPTRPGVALLPDLSDRTADALLERLRAERRDGDVVVVSVHWGGNWGYAVPGEQRRFAHRLVDGGVRVVHGHSSHHPRPVEVHRGGLVLYGCGDLVNDYEGIGGYEPFRDDLRTVVHARLDAEGHLTGVRLVPFRARRLRLEHANADEARWLADRLREHAAGPGGEVRLDGTGTRLVVDVSTDSGRAR